VGFGTGGKGWLEVFIPTSDPTMSSITLLQHSAWLHSAWPDYNNGSSGEMHPAMGNLDDDALAEIVVGVEHYPGNDGWLLVFDDATTGYFDRGWFSLQWEEFRNNGGGTYPAIARR
jgi:hypothetical protein